MFTQIFSYFIFIIVLYPFVNFAQTTCSEKYGNKASCKASSQCNTNTHVSFRNFCPSNQECCVPKWTEAECSKFSCDECRYEIALGCTFCEGDLICQKKGKNCPSGNNADSLLWWPCSSSTTSQTAQTATPQPTQPSEPACAKASVAFGLGLFPLNDQSIASTVAERVFEIDVRDVNGKRGSINVDDWQIQASVEIDGSFVPLNDSSLFTLGDVTASLGEFNVLGVAFRTRVRSTLALNIALLRSQSSGADCVGFIGNSPVVISGPCDSCASHQICIASDDLSREQCIYEKSTTSTMSTSSTVELTSTTDAITKFSETTQAATSTTNMTPTTTTLTTSSSTATIATTPTTKISTTPSTSTVLLSSSQSASASATSPSTTTATTTTTTTITTTATATLLSNSETISTLPTTTSASISSKSTQLIINRVSSASHSYISSFFALLILFFC